MVETTKSKQAYRPDIDGLRAVAVILVILDHLGTRISGGYIGVDVFFVISGYLISATILAEMKRGAFSLTAFYERRARRIAPALIVVLCSTSVAAYLYLLPAALKAYARSMIAALLSVCNILFWRESGYFGIASASKPLLHTWSLAVEEQFYLVYPLLLLAVHRWFARYLKGVVWALTFVSLAAACFYVRHDASTAFYLAPLRAWELLLGTILSQHYVPALSSKAARQITAAGGLLMILASAAIYTAGTSFPGLGAMLPCLGAGCIIYAGESDSTLAGRLLSWPPIVFIGTISYSLYLWHWPLIVFQRTSNILHLSAGSEHRTKVYLFLASILLGTLSWWLVETPFRRGRFRPARRQMFLTTGVGFAILCVLGIVMLRSGGLPHRYSNLSLQIGSYLNEEPEADWRAGDCFLLPEQTFADFKPSKCLANVPGQRHYLLLGDSLAAHLYPGLSREFPEINFSEATSASCPPSLHPPKVGNPYGPDYVTNCRAIAHYIYEDYLPKQSVDGVLLAGVWSEGRLDDLGQLIAWLEAKGIPVILFGPTTMYDAPLPALLVSSIEKRDPGIIRAHFLQSTASLDKHMAELARTQWKVPYISAYDTLCDTRTRSHSGASQDPAFPCTVFAAQGVPLFFDQQHLTVQGSVLFASEIRSRHQLP